MGKWQCLHSELHLDRYFHDPKALLMALNAQVLKVINDEDIIIFPCRCRERRASSRQKRSILCFASFQTGKKCDKQ